MVQVKKPAVREAILGSAMRLFSARGYAGTTLADIAAGAGITPSNVYRYFRSKLEILFALFEPWFAAHLDRLEARLVRIATPEARLRAILRALWHEIPAADNGFNNNLIQALATATPQEGYSRDLLLEMEKRFSALLRAHLPPARRHLARGNLLAHALFMAADGFAMNVKLKAEAPPVEAVIDLVCGLLIDGAPAPRPARGKRPSRNPAQ